MSKELWATYSVRDHLEPRSLAADVMLYDRLVFPVPEEGRFPENSGSPVEIGPVEWAPNTAEWARWEKEKWDPAGQKRLLDVLAPVVRKVPWNSARGPQHDQYRSEAAKLAAQGLPDYAFEATRTTLTRDLPSYVTGVAAVGPAYRSIEAITRDLKIKEASGQRRLPGNVLPAVLAWQFFAPDPNDKRLSDGELLRETVDFVMGDADFRRRRTAFLDWQQKFIKDGMTDHESINKASQEMRALLEDARTATARLAVRKVIRYAFRVAPAGMGLGFAIANVPGGIIGATAGTFISVGAIAVDEMLFKSAEQGQPLPSAFVHDVRRHFGWRSGVTSWLAAAAARWR